jgi:hypothetical protein
MDAAFSNELGRRQHFTSFSSSGALEPAGQRRPAASDILFGFTKLSSCSRFFKRFSGTPMPPVAY